MSRDKKRSNNDVELVLIEDLGMARPRCAARRAPQLFLEHYLAIGDQAGPARGPHSKGSEWLWNVMTILRTSTGRRVLCPWRFFGHEGHAGPSPICASRGVGSHIWDADGNEYIDFALSFGPMLLGQSPAVVLKAVREQLDSGIGFGAGNRYEAPLAELICEIVPSAELVIFSNTGTEAVQVALRVARAVTGRNRIIKFRGHYHGWLDSVHVAIPGCQVMAPEPADRTRCRPGDDDLRVEQHRVAQSALADDVAAVIMEPININGGCFAPEPGYLEEVRRLTRRDRRPSDLR